MPSIATISPKAQSPRIASIESYRVVAMLLVVSLHSNLIARLHLVGGGFGFLVDMPLYLLFWISVPYFFLAAGYFYGRTVDAGAAPFSELRRSCRSLTLLFVIWVAVYSVIGPNWISDVYTRGLWATISTEASHTMDVLIQEHVTLLLVPRRPIFHLWFLPALIAGLSMVALVMTSRLKTWVGPLLVVIYLLLIASAVVPLSQYSPNLLLLGVLFTLLGWWISQQAAVAASFALALIAGGGILAVLEGAVLKRVFHASPHEVMDYPYAGAVLLVVGIFLLTLAYRTIGQNTALPFLARFTLGVYVSHILVEYTLASVHDQLPALPIIWHVLYTLVVYGLSVFLTWGLSKIPWLRLSVTRHAAPLIEHEPYRQNSGLMTPRKSTV
ncbi:MAG: acyltransferase [Nitrospira sp.]|nr:acyltransferase [Nitrospira sp.]